jgi:S-adenosylmethionine synthetase
VRATSVVVSTQHSADLDQETVREIVRPHVVNTLPKGWMCPEPEFYVNPTGRFVIGGPDGDAGLTGRKIIVDTYGVRRPWRRRLSGGDPTRRCRPAMPARGLAKTWWGRAAERCTIQLAYDGVQALSVYRSTHRAGGGKLELAGELVDLAPAASASIRPQQVDLCPHRLWPFRPGAGCRRRLLLGTHRPRGQADEPPELAATPRPQRWALLR